MSDSVVGTTRVKLPAGGPSVPLQVGPRRLEALTSLRFVAAALVVMRHLYGFFSIPWDCWEPWQLTQSVSFFFLLSGFILTYSYPRLQTGTECGRFLLARFARLWPAHALALLLTVLLLHPPTFPLRQIGPRAMAGLNLAMLHAWIPIRNATSSYNGPSWSISAEFFFYLMFPLLIWRLERTWHVKLALTLALAGGLIAYSNWAELPLYGDPSWETCIVGLCYFNPAARLFEFTLGMTAALLWRRLPDRPPRPTVTGTVLEVAALAVAVTAMYYTLPLVTHPWVTGHLGQAGVAWLQHNGVTCLPFALLIVVLACERGWLTRLLSWAPLVLLGEISYSVYLLHIVLLRALAQIVAHWFPEARRSVVLLIFATLLLAMSYLMWRFVEKPARSFLVGLWPRRSKKADTAGGQSTVRRAG